MSKYTPVWQHLQTSNQPARRLSFAELKDILGFDINHSFLTYKKECQKYGYKVAKISLKNKTVDFKRLS